MKRKRGAIVMINHIEISKNDLWLKFKNTRAFDRLVRSLYFAC